MDSEVFKDIIRQGGLDRYWAATRYPEFCRPVGEDDFACSMMDQE
jgi:hypothetical protein